MMRTAQSSAVLADQPGEFERLACSTAPHRMVLRARALLLAADEIPWEMEAR